MTIVVNIPGSPVTPPVVNPTDPCAAAKAMVDAYIVAEQALLSGKQVAWGDRSIRREDLNMIRDGRREWEARYAGCMACQSGAERSRIGGLRTTLADFGNADSNGGNGDD